MEMKKKRPVGMELKRPENVQCPYEKEYACDVAVVGCGFAGLNAAVSAKEEGRSVIVIDKGRPGFSGLAPWASSFRWFDPERGDDAGAYRKAIQIGGDYLSNQKWYEIWARESKGIYVRLTKWGILEQYPRAAEAGGDMPGEYYVSEDLAGYRERFARFDRRTKWMDVLRRYGIFVIEHTMAAEILVGNGAAAGVLGFHVPSAQPVVVRAKAVVLATGGGSYKPTGYPVGGDTFDGEAMAYELGLPITGKEFEDFHGTSSTAPGNVLIDNHWQYLENIWLCGGDVTEEDAVRYAATKGNAMLVGRIRDAMNGVPAVDGTAVQDVADADPTRRGAAKRFGADGGEVRGGKRSTPVAASDLPGGAAGMCCHLTSGVFCGTEDADGATAIPGLFVAGDGTHATAVSGSAYPCGVGFTSGFTSIEGDHAGRAAARFAEHAAAADVPKDVLAAKLAAMLAPLAAKRGFDANWARDVLHAAMAPYWVSIVKTEESLRAALFQVEYLRDHVVPRLIARSGHDLRLCIEMRHKVLSAELKLRAGLARRESRGSHFREDIPHRNDAEFLCYITLRKGEDGSVAVGRVPVPEAWAGDVRAPYRERYAYFFPGELESLAAETKTEGGEAR